MNTYWRTEDSVECLNSAGIELVMRYIKIFKKIEEKNDARKMTMKEIQNFLNQWHEKGPK